MRATVTPTPSGSEQPPESQLEPAASANAFTEQPEQTHPEVQNAQEGIEFWTAAIFWATLASVAVAGVALWGLIAQLRNNRRSAEQQLRAYLAIKPLGIVKLIGSRHVLGQVLLKNVGSTLAKNVSLEVHAALDTFKGRESFPVGGDTKEVPRALQPGDEMPQGSKNTILMNDIQAAENYIYIWGVAHYDDGFSNRRFTRFCHRYACASHDRDAYRKAGAKGVREALILISPDKARLNDTGNDAD